MKPIFRRLFIAGFAAAAIISTHAQDSDFRVINSKFDDPRIPEMGNIPITTILTADKRVVFFPPANWLGDLDAAGKTVSYSTADGASVIRMKIQLSPETNLPPVAVVVSAAPNPGDPPKPDPRIEALARIDKWRAIITDRYPEAVNISNYQLIAAGQVSLGMLFEYPNVLQKKTYGRICSVILPNGGGELEFDLTTTDPMDTGAHEVFRMVIGRFTIEKAPLPKGS